MERWTIAGVALLSSALLMFGLSLAMEGIVATVLQAVAAVDGLLGAFLLMRGIQRTQ